MGNPLTSASFIRLMDDRLTKLFTKTFSEYPNVIPEIGYTVIKDKKLWTEYFGIGAVPDPQLFNGTIQFQSVYPTYHYRVETKEYAGGIVCERKFLEGQRYEKIDGDTIGLAEAATRKRNKLAVEPFAYADSSAFTFVQSEEGVAWASNSHTTKAVGVSTSTGFDNLATLPFNAVNLEVLRLQHVRLKNDIGELIDINPDTIIHGPGLDEAVWQVRTAEGDVDSDLNNQNFQRGKWKTLRLPQLDAYFSGDCKSWGIADSRLLKKFLIWHDFIPIEFEAWNDPSTKMRQYSDYFSCGNGPIGWQGIVWSVVT